VLAKTNCSHLERLQPLDQPARALHGDPVVQRIRFAADVVVGGQMHDRRQAGTEALPNRIETLRDPGVGAEVERDDGAVPCSRRHAAIEAHHPTVRSKPRRQRPADEALCAGDDDDV
jgi:hypothetical protein